MAHRFFSLFFVAAATFYGATSMSIPKGSCDFEGERPHPTNCEKFLVCSEGHDPQEMDCPLGPDYLPLFFNPELLVCDYRRNVNCNGGSSSVVPRPVIPRPVIPVNPPAPVIPVNPPAPVIPVNPPAPVIPVIPPVIPVIPPVIPVNPPAPVIPVNPPQTAGVPQEISVCYGTRGDDFGSIVVPADGFLRKVMLTHESGQVSCYSEMAETFNRWGCSSLFSGKMGVFISRSKEDILYPAPQVERDSYNFYVLAGENGTPFGENDDFIYFKDNEPRVFVQAGERLQIGYGEDYLDIDEENINSGRHCVRVSFEYFTL